MKKLFIIIGSLLVLLVAAALILPVVFKDDIKNAIDKELASSVNADVVFDVDKFSLSLFRHFPNITAKMGDFGVINREPFKGEVLFGTRELTVDLNLMDVLFGNNPRIKGITLIDPVINIRVLKDGRANYDIAIPSADSLNIEDSDEGGFSFSIDHWEIVNGDISYDDQSIPYTLQMKGVHHTGSGDFTQDAFDLTTHTTADSVATGYDGVTYLSDKKVVMDAVISISEDYSRFTFKENKVQVNDFALGFDGWFKMNENDYDMDITFNSPENSFKSLLSLVPGMYSGDFDKIQTSGSLAFNGMVKGVMSETAMPAYKVQLLVGDAMFKYPDLPTPVNNINLDVTIENKDGVMENTTVDLKKLHLDLGNNPVDAKAMIRKIYPTDLDASLSAKLNLAELGKMFPMEGLEMKGSYSINLVAKGVYDSLKKTIPSIDATMSMANGYIKSSDFPVPLEDMKFSASVKSPSGKMEETAIVVNNFSMLMEGERLTADLALKNLSNMSWDAKVNGSVDLEKVTKVVPIDGMTLTGKITADIQTKGNMAALEAQRYDQLPTSGSASVEKFTYASKDLPYVVTIKEAKLVFDPRKIDLAKFDGTAGKSDFQINGTVNNYLGYMLKDEELKGAVTFKSQLLDLNEFMTDEETSSAPADSASYGVIPVPRNIDFLLHSSITTTHLMDLTLNNTSGDIVVKDGIANLKNLRFNLLGGAFLVNGDYNTVNIEKPTYDFQLKIDNLSIRESANAFTIVKKLAPVAGLVNGSFSTDFNIGGVLGNDLMPLLGTVNGGGLVKIAEASLTGSKLVSGVTSLTKLENTENVSLKDVLMSASIKDGRLSVKPFDVKFGDYKTTVAGSSGIDGSIDYSLKMDVPAGKLGSQFNSFVSQYTGGSSNPSSTVPVTIGLGGTFANPSTKLLMDEQKEQAKEAVTNKAKEEATEKVQELVKGTEAEKVLNNILSNKKDSTSGKDSTAVKPSDAVKEKVQQEAADKIQNLLKRKK